MFVDLSHPIEPGMPTFPGLEPPKIGAVVDHDSSGPRYQGKAEFLLGSIEMPTNTGTYLDSPFHRYREGRDLADLRLDEVCGLRGVVIDHDPAGGRPIDVELPPDLKNAAILFRTGWSARWGSEAYWDLGPYLSDELVTSLIERDVRLVGVDFWNVDDTENPARPAHTRLLEKEILIVEHLCNLEALPPSGFRFFAPTLGVKGGASFPVRAFAEL